MKWLKNIKRKKTWIAVGILIFIVFIAKTFFINSPLADILNQDIQGRNKNHFMEGYRIVKNIEQDEIITEDMLEAVPSSIEQSPAQLEEILNSKAKMKLAKGILLTDSHLRSKENLSDDMRIHNFPYIRLTNQMKKGDYIDVRISFANGGDFVLLSKKKIEEISFLDTEGTKENSLWLKVSEEELLRLSSAVVDAYLNEGCKIYAIEYISETQKEAVVNYTVSSMIKKLMEDDPNITERAGNIMEWALWEEYKKNNSKLSKGADSSPTANDSEEYSDKTTEVDIQYVE